MLGVLRQRNFTLLWLGSLISAVGDWGLLIALPFFVYEITGSALATGAMFMAETLPRVLISSIAGVLVDRWDRKRTMIVANIVRAALLLLLLTVHTADQLWVVYLVAFFQAGIAQFFSPASSALLPRVVGEKDLLAANALNSVSAELVRIVAPAFGGTLMGLLGLASIVLLDSASFLFSAAMIALVRLPATAAPAPATRRSVFATVWREWLDGLRLVRGHQVVVGLFVVMGAAMVGQGIINAVLVAFVRDVLGGAARELGWIASAQGIGGLFGALIIGRVGVSFAANRVIAAGGVATGLFILAIANAPSLVFVVVLVALAGLPVMGFFVPVQTLLQRSVDDHYRGRVFGAFGTTNALLTLIGLGLGGALGDALGVIPMLSTAGILYLLAGALALSLTRSEATSRPVRANQAVSNRG